MRRFFTKNLMLVALGFVSFGLTAQINTLTINSPAGIEGNYTAVRAAFGSAAATPITANAVFIEDGDVTGTGGTIYDGCQPAVNSATGLIAFVDRGVCEFSAKALTAQNAGAIAVIVCNNAANAAQAPFSMAVGGFGDMVTVPVFMISYTDCQTIRTNIISGGVNATLRFFCENTSNYGPEVIWGDGPDANGNRGDFAGGLNGWSIDNENTWEFDATGEILGGAFGGTTMDSYTDCDGIMKFNSDFRDNGGVQNATGTGDGGCVAPCRGALISPNIDLSAFTIEGLTIEFHQALRQFRSEYYLMASKDNGVTWPDTIQFNEEFPTNSETFNNLRTKIALQGFAGASQIRFKFEYVGNYYYWGIDDVVLYNELITDAKVNENWFAVAPSIKTPKSQVAPMPFMADISNLGNLDATGVQLEVVISEGTDEVARFNNTYGALGAGQVLENDIFADSFTPAETEAFYTGSYVISANEEAEAQSSNNSVDFIFEITEKTFGNLLAENQITTPNYMEDVTDFWVVEPGSYYSAGNIYFVPKGNGYVVENVRFGLNNDFGEIAGSGFITVDLYEWNNADGGRTSEETERTLVGTNTIFLDDAEIPNARNIEIPLFQADGSGQAIEDTKVALKDNTNYILVAHSEPFDAGTGRYEFLSYSGTSNSVVDRSVYSFPTATVLDSLELNRYAGSLYNFTGVAAEDRFSRVLQPVGNPDLQAYAGVYLEMDIVEANSTYEVNENVQVSTFPNPAATELYIDITLKNVSNEVRVELVNMEGKVVTNKTFNNVLDSRLKLDLSSVPAGAYSALIHTNEGVVTKKVVVQK